MRLFPYVDTYGYHPILHVPSLRYRRSYWFSKSNVRAPQKGSKSATCGWKPRWLISDDEVESSTHFRRDSALLWIWNGVLGSSLLATSNSFSAIHRRSRVYPWWLGLVCNPLGICDHIGLSCCGADRQPCLSNLPKCPNTKSNLFRTRSSILRECLVSTPQNPGCSARDYCLSDLRPCLGQSPQILWRTPYLLCLYHFWFS